MGPNGTEFIERSNKSPEISSTAKKLLALTSTLLANSNSSRFE